MFPYSEHLPPAGSEQARNSLIPTAISPDLRRPVFQIARRHATMLRTAMPEAAIDKQGDTFFSKDEVGPARQRNVPPPAADPVRSQNRHKLQLGVFVSARSN
jgi:hypothetical protein